MGSGHHPDKQQLLASGSAEHQRGLHRGEGPQHGIDLPHSLYCHRGGVGQLSRSLGWLWVEHLRSCSS